jgi:hypothetical protein
LGSFRHRGGPGKHRGPRLRGQPDLQGGLSVSTDCKTHCRCGFAGAKLNAALAHQPIELEIVKRIDEKSGFKVVRRRIKDWE